MRAVNLLPRDFEQARKRPATPVIVGCAGAVVATAVLAVGYLSASSKVGSENSQLAAVQAQIAALPQPAQPPATVSSLPQERQLRVTALASALAQRVAWDRILREVSLVLPDDVWLDSLDATAPVAPAPGVAAAAPTQPTGFTITGFTYSQSAVARLLARLTVIPDLEDVTLQSATQSAQTNASSPTTTAPTGPTVIDFTIMANIRAPGATS